MIFTPGGKPCNPFLKLAGAFRVSNTSFALIFSLSEMEVAIVNVLSNIWLGVKNKLLNLALLIAEPYVITAQENRAATSFKVVIPLQANIFPAEFENAKTYFMGKSKKNIVSQSHPLAKRKTLYSIENKTGDIVALDNSNYGIRAADEATVLLPVNLPAELQKNGIKVKFSAQAKEISLTELWAGQPILLSHVEKI
jgi:hypothetical protein